MPRAIWAKFENDFNSMTDADVAYETRRMQDQFDEAEEWLEAVSGWQADGKPRTEQPS